MDEHTTPPFDELLLNILRNSDGRTPAGLTERIAFLVKLLAEQEGLPNPNDESFVPPDTAEKSGRAITAEARIDHHVQQHAADNPQRVADRDAAIACGDTAAVLAKHKAALDKLRAALQKAKALGFGLDVHTAPAAAFANEDGR